MFLLCASLFIVSMHLTRCDVVSFFFLCFLISCIGAAIYANKDYEKCKRVVTVDWWPLLIPFGALSQALGLEEVFFNLT